MMFFVFFDIMYVWEDVWNIERNDTRAVALVEGMEMLLLILFCFLQSVK